MQFCTDEKLPKDHYVCYCQSDCGPMDSTRYAEMGVSSAEGEKNQEYLDYYRDRGVNMVGTCVPYMCGFIPLRGEHYVSSESHAVTLMNSLWGAAAIQTDSKQGSGQQPADVRQNGETTLWKTARVPMFSM